MARANLLKLATDEIARATGKVIGGHGALACRLHFDEAKQACRGDDCHTIGAGNDFARKSVFFW
jgi:hypothetical protein